MISGRSARSRSGRVSTGEPQSRISSVPASRSVCACVTHSDSGTGPSGPSPTWQCASTSPGTRKPASTSVCAPGSGPSTNSPAPSTYSSASSSPSGPSSLPRTRNPGTGRVARVGCATAVSAPRPPQAVHLLLRELQLRRVEPRRELVHAEPGGQLAQARRQRREVRHAGGRPCPRPGSGLSLRALLPPAALGQALGRAAAAEAELASHLLHHLAGLEEAVDQVVDLAHRHPGAVRDAQPPRAVDDLRIGAFGRGHAADDGLQLV